MAQSIVTPIGMLSFPNLFEARAAAEGAAPRFSLNLVFDEAAMRTPEFKKLQDEINEAAKEVFGAKIPAGLRMPIRNADEKDYAGYDAGKTFIGAWSKTRPGVVDGSRNEVHLKEDVWAGQLARAYVRPFAYNNSGNKGVALMLEAVQIVKKDMPRLDGRKAAKDVFGEVADADSELV